MGAFFAWIPTAIAHYCSPQWRTAQGRRLRALTPHQPGAAAGAPGSSARQRTCSSALTSLGLGVEKEEGADYSQGQDQVHPHPHLASPYTLTWPHPHPTPSPGAPSCPQASPACSSSTAASGTAATPATCRGFAPTTTTILLCLRFQRPVSRQLQRGQLLVDMPHAWLRTMAALLRPSGPLQLCSTVRVYYYRRGERRFNQAISASCADLLMRVLGLVNCMRRIIR